MSVEKRLQDLELKTRHCKGFDDPRYFKLVNGCYERIPQPSDKPGLDEPLFRFVSPGEVDKEEF